MEFLMNKVQTEFGFSDYQIKLIRYSITALFYDISKMIIFAVYFYCTGKLLHLFFALCPLILLRTKTGGIHFKKYWTCFFFTFIYLQAAINILPAFISVHPLAIYIILLICAVADYLIGPNSLTRKTPANENFVKKAKLEAFQLILIIAILFFIFSADEYLIVSFWTVVLHTIQLTITKILKEVNVHEKLASKSYF